MALIWCHFKPSPTHVICYNSNLLSHPQRHDHHLGEDHLDGDHLVDVNESESRHDQEKALPCCQKSLSQASYYHDGLWVVIIVIKVVIKIMIVPSQESNNKSEFNNCISTETAESFYEVCD